MCYILKLYFMFQYVYIIARIVLYFLTIMRKYGGQGAHAMSSNFSLTCLLNCSGLLVVEESLKITHHIG